MTLPGRRDPVGRWRRRPWWWALLFTGFGLLLVLPDVTTAREQDRLQARGLAVPGRILPTWDRSTRIPVRYTHPVTGRQVDALAPAPYDVSGRIRSVDLKVDPDDPSDVRIDEPVDQRPWVEGVAQSGALVAACVVWGITRRRRMATTRRLMDGDTTTYRMVAVPAPGRVLPRRWRLSLYALDARPGDRPVCTVAVVGTGTDTGARTVDVKGQPRPGGSVAIREADEGRTWWPASRVLLGGRDRRPALDDPGPVPERRHWSWALVGAGVVLVVVSFVLAGESPDDIGARGRAVTVVVTRSLDADDGDVPVRFDLDGTPRTATVHLAGPQREGQRLRLLVDTEHPARLWQPGTEDPGGRRNEGWSIVALIAGIALLTFGILGLKRPAPGAARPAPPGWIPPPWPPPPPPRSWPPPPPPPPLPPPPAP